MHDRAGHSENHRLGVFGLLALSLPSLLFAGFDLARRTYLPVFLTGELGVSLATAALFMGLTGLWGVAMEFLASIIGDRGGAYLGPRRLWIMVGTLGIVAATAAIVMALDAGFVPFMVAFLALIASWTLCNVTHGAWALEAGQTAHERAGIFGLRMFFAIAGGTGFALLAAGMAQGYFFRGIPAFIALTSLTGLAIPLLHGLLIVGQPSVRASISRSQSKWRFAPIKLLLENSRHRRLAWLYGLAGFQMGIAGATFLLTARDGLSLGVSADVVLGIYTASAALGALASARWGAACRSELMLGLLMGLKLVLALALLLLPRGEVTVFAIWAVVAGMFGTLHLIVLRLLLGESLDGAALKAPQGEPKGALFYAAFHIPLNLGLAGGAALALAALDTVGFRATPYKSEQTSYLAVVVPALMLAGVSIISIFSVRGIDRLFGQNRSNSDGLSRRSQQANYLR